MEITTRTLKQNIRLPVVVETLTIQISNPPTAYGKEFASFWIQQYVEFQELIAKYSMESYFCGDDYNAFTCLLMDAKLLLNQEISISREDVKRFLNLMKNEVEILNEKLPLCYIMDQEIHILKAPKVALLTQCVNNAISLLN